MTSFIVNASTSLVQVDSSQISPGIPAVVFLSSINNPGTIVTIRDSFGEASQTKKIVVSTTTGLNFLEGPSVSSYVITQPYGFLTVSPKTPNIWAVVNTFAFPDQSATAIVNNLNTNNIRVSTITNDIARMSTAGISTLVAGNLYVYTSLSVAQSTITSTLAVRDMAIFEKNVTILSSLTVGSSITTSSMLVASSLKVNQLDLQMSTGWVMDSGGPVKIAGPVSTLSTISAGGTISTLANLGVGQSTMIYGQLMVRRDSFFEGGLSTISKLGVGAEVQILSTLSVKDESLFRSHLSTLSNVNIAGGLSTLSNVAIDRELFVRSSITTFSTISTNWDINVGRNLSVQQTLAVGGDIIYKNRVLDFTNFSVLQDLFVFNNISTQSSIYAGLNLIVNGSTLLQGPVSSGSTHTVLSHLSTLGNFATGGSSEFLSTVLISSAVSTNWNMTVRGLISTQSTLVVGHAITALQQITTFSNFSTPSSIVAGNQITAGGHVQFLSSMSTVGPVAFFSSLQLQGSLSVFSSIGVACNVTIGGTLTANSFALPGAAQISSLTIMQQSNFVLTVSSSTLQVGLFSTMGDIRMGGRFSTQNVVAIGSTLFAGFVAVQSNMSSFGTFGNFGDANFRSNVTIGGATSNLGATSVGDTFTVANATTLNGTTQINNSLVTTGNVTFQNFLQVNNTINALNGLQITAANNCNLISNYTHMSTLGVRGQVGFSTLLFANNMFASTLGTSSITTTQTFTSSLFTSSIWMSWELQGRFAGFSTVGILQIGNSSIQTSSLTGLDIRVSSLTTSSMFLSRDLLGSNAGFSTATVLQIANSSIMTSTVMTLVLRTSSLMTSTMNVGRVITAQENTSSIVCSSIAIRNASPLAILDILGGAISDGTAGSNLIAFQYNDPVNGGYRHFITSRHNAVAGNACNAIDIWLNNSATAAGSATAGTGNTIGMTVTQQGTGILTRTPQYGLDVNSSLRAVGNITANASTIMLNGTFALSLSQRNVDGTATIQALNNQTATSLLINPMTGSKVGILCNAPSQALDVGGNVMIGSGNTLYFRSAIGRKVSLWGETANSYYGIEIQSSEFRNSVDTGGHFTWGRTDATPTYTRWASLSNYNFYLNSANNTSNRFVMGPSPSFTNLDYCSMITSCNASSGNYGSELGFWTHGFAGNAGDPIRAMFINYLQRTTLVAPAPYEERGGLILSTQLNINALNTNGYLRLGHFHTNGVASCGVIQASDIYNNPTLRDNGVLLCINPRGGNVAIGDSNASFPLDVKGNTRVQGDLTVTGAISGGSSLPLGVIVIWSGASNAVPSRWSLCNGANGTPNLTDRFVLGGGGTRAVSTTGGTSNVILGVNNIPPHRHLTGQFYGNGEDGSGITYMGQGPAVIGNFSGSIYNSANALQTAEGNNPAAVDKMPPFYVLCYIQYTG